ncbi:MAG TPA: 30S ribosome-binding factor RbfA [Clostridiaceae bacterium]|nr:30S ribosome-binding factor RbfA [Clostridiaceae bacterium]
MSNREVRVSWEVKRILSELVRDLKDPRKPTMLSITDVKVTRDFSHANVYFSVYGSVEEKENGRLVLESSKGFLRRELGKRIRLRKVPELHMLADDSIERGFVMDALIDEVISNDEMNRLKQGDAPEADNSDDDFEV